MKNIFAKIKDIFKKHNTLLGGISGFIIAGLIFSSVSFASTITTINGSDTVSGSRTTINTNFSNLNTDKLEATNINTFTVLQKLYGNASTTGLSANYASIGGSATTTFNMNGTIIIGTTTAGTLKVTSTGLIYSSSSAGNGTVTSVTASTPNSTLTLGGTNPVTTSGTISFDINLAHSNIFTALQQFNGNASTTVLSVSQTGSATTTILSNATSTFATGINISGGCFAIANSCIGGSGGGGTVTSITAGNGLTGGVITTSGTIALSTVSLANGGTATTTGGVTNGIEYYNGTALTNSYNMLFDGTNLGIGTSTPGSILSVGNTNGINFSTATSTFNSTGGIKINSGCFQLINTCINGTVTSVGLSDANSTLTIGSTPVTTTGTITATLNLAHANTWSALQQFAIASSTTFSAGYVAVGQTATTTIDRVGNITDPGTLNVTGQTTLGNASTTRLSINNIAQYAYKTPGAGYATTSSWTGTTTQAIGALPSPFTAQIINSVQCYTDAGTLDVDIFHTSTHLTMFIASTTENINSFSSNNTMTAGEKWYIQFGTPATSPSAIKCTFNLTPTGII